MTPYPTPPSLATICASTEAFSSGPIPVFPGAEGFGTETVAGSGRHLPQPCTAIVSVSNLEPWGSGSLRECAEASGPRVCVFEVGGEIVLPADGPIRIRSPFLTIAGQTAPYPGIVLRGAGIRVEASDVLIEHLRVRVGEDPNLICCATNSCVPEFRAWCDSEKAQPDGISINATQNAIQRVVLDHLSISWALDEGLSIVPAIGDISDITVSNMLIGQALDDSIHPKVTEYLRKNIGKLDGHSMGVLVSGENRVSKFSFHHSLLAHNAERNIRVGSSASIEFVNNLIYNWGRGGGVAKLFECTNSASNPAIHALDLIGNRYEAGLDSYCPETLYHPYRCFLEYNFPYLHLSGDGVDMPSERAVMHRVLRVGFGQESGLTGASRYFLSDNFGPTRTDAASDEWSIVDTTFFTDSERTALRFPLNRSLLPIVSSGLITIEPSLDAREHVLVEAGARRTERDPVDEQIVSDVRTGGGHIINCVSADGTSRCAKNAGGWPTYPASFRSLELPENPLDDSDGDGYTNLEEWLHESALAFE